MATSIKSAAPAPENPSPENRSPQDFLPLDFAERLESLKAGSFSAIAAAIIFSSLTLLHGFLPDFLPLSQPPATLTSLGIKGAIAVLSSFLFGITYRYIVRQDQNPHLKSGAVLAFGLVRGLAQVELLWQTPAIGLAVLVGESLLLFAGDRLLLDWALSRAWLKAS
jgi:hypothetical protein